MKRVQQGFTLIELMIVVAIIGILAAVAIPQYQNYVIKAKMANALSGVDSFKAAVAQCAQENGGVTTSCSDAANNGAAGVIPAFTATKEIASVAVNAGQITATLATGIGTNIDGQTIVFTPAVNESNVTWQACPGGNFTSANQAAAFEAVTKNNVTACP